MAEILLPASIDHESINPLPGCAQISIVGANGAGKTKFMSEMMDLCGEKAYSLSALNAMIPDSGEKKRPGSIGDLYEKAIASRPYIRQDAVSEAEKLMFMLLTDEFEHLMRLKLEKISGQTKSHGDNPTRLDRLVDLWETIFPGNHVLHDAGNLLFATSSGSNNISLSRLSQGERAVFYYIAGVLYAKPGAVIFIDSPSLFLHPSILNNLWNSIEGLRPDCKFVYNSVDMDFIGSRAENVCLWVKRYDVENKAWDYEILEKGSIPDDLYSVLLGNRKPVLFIEGDARHSIDMRLYSLVFTDFAVCPLGSCNKVIESVRSFNDLRRMHKLDSHGIVDRDRRTDEEVAYLRHKNILVPEVAEVENIFLTENVIRIMAGKRKKNPDKVFASVRKSVMRSFASMTDRQALEHVRHRVKRDVERRIDARFTCITALEMHLNKMKSILHPRETYNRIRKQFVNLVDNNDYKGVLKVFNHKPMLNDSNVARLLGYNSTEQYIASVMNAMKSRNAESQQLREAIRALFPMPGCNAGNNKNNLRKT